MTYQETIDWMFTQLPMYQKIGSQAYKKDLHNTEIFIEYLNHPENKFKSIHVGGTNGKGSTSSMLASILQEAGYKVGLYTSPHLKDYRERIRINGEMISEEYVVNFVASNKAFLSANSLSFFEMTVGLAFDYFATQKVDVAIIEVGLGGQLDSTNIIKPLLSVITNVGYDHMAILGDTLTAIATEKAGIIKERTPVVIGQYTAETKTVFETKAALMNAPIWYASDIKNLSAYPSGLKGNYQVHNQKTVLTAVNCLKAFFTISNQSISAGLLHVQKNTGLAGRWEILSQEPLIVADTAHNKDGLLEVMAQVKQQQYENLYMVLGVVNDKDVDEMLSLLPKSAHYFISTPNVPRGLAVEILADKMKSRQFHFTIASSIPAAFDLAKQKASSRDMIYVGGSTFVVAEIL